MNQGYKRIIAVTACLMAACVCYSCSRMSWNPADLRGRESLGFSTDTDRSAVADGSDAAGSKDIGSKDIGSKDSPGVHEQERGTGGVTVHEQETEAGSGGLEGFPAPSADRMDTAVCYVHICGEVTSPGVYELTAGSRIFEAVEKAGGFTDQAAVSYLNMAQQVCDGMKIVVPGQGDIAAGEQLGQGAVTGQNGEGSNPGIYVPKVSADGTAGMALSGQTPPESGKVNLNTADKALLMTLKGIGEARADAILNYREAYGPFRKIEDIMNVSGIKDGAFQKIKDDITV